MKKVFLAPILAMGLIACGNTSKPASTDSVATDSSAVVAPVTAVEATFVGLLPQADGAGFDTTLELKADARFGMLQVTEKHRDSIAGAYTLVGDTLTLHVDGGEQRFALLQGDSVVLLNADKQVNEVPAYVLRKK